MSDMKKVFAFTLNDICQFKMKDFEAIQTIWRLKGQTFSRSK